MFQIQLVQAEFLLFRPTKTPPAAFRRDLGVHSHHSACLRTISSCCQIQSTPNMILYLANAKIHIFFINRHVFHKKVVILHNILRLGVFSILNNMYAYL